MLELDKNNIVSLFDLFDIPKGYVFDHLWGCTYSANDTSVNELRKRLKVNYNFESRKKWENGESVCIYVQQGNYVESYLPNFIHPITPKKGNNPKNAHAKVFLIKYVNKDRAGIIPLYRLIVTSANLTKSKEMNVYTVIEGHCNSCDTNDQNGVMAGLKELIKKYDHELKYLNGLIENNVVFDDQIKFINVSEATRELLIDEANKAESVIIISPFLDASVISDFSEQGKLTVISLSQEIEKICTNNDFNKVDFRVLNMDDLDYSLHAKVYAFKKENRTVLYMGSANATESAFNGNIEVLVKIFDKDNGFLDTIQLFEKYYPSGKYDQLAKDEEFQKKCRGVIGSFSADLENYFISNSEGMGIKLKYKDKEINPRTEECKKICWERTDKYRHFVELTISKDGKSHTATLMVDGMKNELDEKELNREVQEDIAQRFGASLLKGTGKNGKDQDNSAVVNGSRGINCLYSVACKISKKDEAANFTKVYEEMKDCLCKEDIETAENVIRDIKAVYKDLVLEPTYD